MRLRNMAAATVIAIGLLSTTANLQQIQKGGEDETGPYDVVAELAAAVGEARLHLGIAAGCVRRDAEPDLSRRARRAEAARHTRTRLQRHLGIARRARDRAEGRDAQLHPRRGRQRQGRRSLEPVGQPLRRQHGPAQGEDQPVRSRTPRVDRQRLGAPDLRVHQRRQATGEDAGRDEACRATTRSISASRRTSRFCPTGRW